MTPWILLLAGILLCVLVAWFFPRSAAPPPGPAPDDLEQQLDRLIVLRAALSADHRERHLRSTRKFLEHKRMVPCGELAEITEHMRVSIAGLACLLVLRPHSGTFPAVKEILLYPDAFVVQHQAVDEDGLVSDEPVALIGESWHGDRVILAWAEVEHALQGGHGNVVAHEFAHQLDDETPGAPGVPWLPHYERWAEVMSREYERLQRHRRPLVLDPYGATNPAEFFAVATEAFMQRGADLRRHHADLYRLLADYFEFESAPPEHPH